MCWIILRITVCYLHFYHVFAAWNVDSKSNCDPAKYPDEGDGYCTGRMEGWNAWGSIDWINLDTGRGACMKAGHGGCQCADCGPSMTYCKDLRCDDDKGHATFNFDKQEYECWVAGTKNEKAEFEWYDFCFSHKADCDLTPCARGQYLSGCKRASPGTCVSCPVAVTVGKQFWGAVGHGVASCKLLPCSVPAAGQFIKAECNSNTDTVIKSCAEYPGNKQSTKDMSAEQLAAITSGQKGVFDVDRFYCPAGNLVLALPANSITNDYISFECKPGFYLSEGVCFQCPSGSACMNGKQTVCPVNYYSKALASTACTLCTSACSGSNQKPLRCKAGSTFDAGCVSCGACGYSSDVGLTCVENNYEMQALKQQCSPPVSGEWQCKA